MTKPYDSCSKEEQAAITAIRDAVARQGRADWLCASNTCLYRATTKVFWPVLAGEEYPQYCDSCAEWAKEVLRTLGHRADSEPLPRASENAPPHVRSIQLED